MSNSDFGFGEWRLQPRTFAGCTAGHGWICHESGGWSLVPKGGQRALSGGQVRTLTVPALCMLNGLLGRSMLIRAATVGTPEAEELAACKCMGFAPFCSGENQFAIFRRDDPGDFTVFIRSSSIGVEERSSVKV